uniref:AAA+ ATPase domain-containing protein n=1 Tax=viral metagenome TaxID=1070528 RepID=A0A6C0KMA2_9ZZZZ
MENNKNNKIIKNIRFNRNFTDINKYNNFLLELDNKIRSDPLYYCNNTELSERSNIKKFVKNIDYNFTESNLNNTNFLGQNILDSLISSIEKNIDSNPNLYLDDNNNINNNILDNEICFYKKLSIDKKKINIEIEINQIADLLDLIEKYPDDKEVEYNINMSALHNIKEPLTQLNNMIGIKSLKENIIDQILYYLQNLHSLKPNIQCNEFMHTVIFGDPGTGKTEIAKIIGNIFSKLGILTKGTFKKVTRADLIAGYLGQTSLKTRDVIKECLGGVLFIDEAYALGNEEKRDSFSKECIDTLCEALSDHKENLMVIIAGYENELQNCFFNYNQGLNSRFPWRFKTEEYSAEELYQIFLKKVNDNGWSLLELNKEWFEKHKSHFKFSGRDIENLFTKTKIAHSRRVFCLDPSLKKKLTIKDINKGFEMYLKNEEKESDKEKLNKIMSSMYV